MLLTFFFFFLEMFLFFLIIKTAHLKTTTTKLESNAYFVRLYLNGFKVLLRKFKN